MMFARRHSGTARARRVAAREMALDVLWLLALVAGLPFLILALGTPVALLIRLLLWFGDLL